MPYIKETCVAGNTIEVSKYYTIRYHSKGGSRADQENESTDRMKRHNQRRAQINLRRLMNTNFHDGDYLVRLDFRKEEAPPGSVEMQEMIQKALRKLRQQFKKAGKELKYIYVKEIGPKGGRHLHMMLSKCDVDWLRKCWTHGAVHVDPLYSEGQYRKIAAYFIKYASRTEETEGELIGKRWYASRNLVRPQVVKTVMLANKFREKPTIPKGYYLDKETEISGVSEVTGFRYYSYTLIRAGDG